MERMSVVELRETLAREIASLPEALRACTGARSRTNARIFSDEDHERCAPVHASFPVSRLRPAPRVPQTNM